MDAVAETRTIAATMTVGAYYEYNCPLVPRQTAGTFEGWTDFGWMVFTTNDGETTFVNPITLAAIRPETFDSTVDYDGTTRAQS